MRKSWKTHWETIIEILMRDEPTWWLGLEKCGTGLRTSQKQTKCLIPWRTEPWRRGSYKGNLLTAGFWLEKLSDGGTIVKGHLENNPESQWWPVSFWVPGLGRPLNSNLISIWPGRCDRGILACVLSPTKFRTGAGPIPQVRVISSPSYTKLGTAKAKPKEDRDTGWVSFPVYLFTNRCQVYFVLRLNGRAGGDKMTKL